MGIRGFGLTREDAFVQTALAMCAISVDLETVNPDSAVTFSLEESDQELLLVQWLNQILYEMNTRVMVFGRCEVTIHNSQLQATLWGEPFDPDKHCIGTEVKAATFALLKVEQRADSLWVAQCIVDV
jgi:tRNA nucleotidyltransferase (CCA-adding enzyme)